MQVQPRHAEALRKTDLAPATQRPQADCEAGTPGPQLRAVIRVRDCLLCVSKRHPDLRPGAQRIPRILRKAPDRPVVPNRFPAGQAFSSGAVKRINNKAGAALRKGQAADPESPVNSRCLMRLPACCNTAAPTPVLLKIPAGGRTG